MAEPSEPDDALAANAAWLSGILWPGPPPPVDHIRRRPGPGDRPPVPLELPEHLLDEVKDVSVIEISGLPEGATLTRGRQIEPGLWQIDPAQLDSVALVPAPTAAGEAFLSVGVTGLEPEGEDLITAFGTALVHIPDPPPPPRRRPKPKAAPPSAETAADPAPRPSTSPPPATETAPPPKPRRRLALKLAPVDAKPPEPKRRLSLKLAPVETAPAAEPEKAPAKAAEKTEQAPKPKPQKAEIKSVSKPSPEKAPVTGESKPAATSSTKPKKTSSVDGPPASAAKAKPEPAEPDSKSATEAKRDSKPSSAAKPDEKTTKEGKPASKSKPDEKASSKKKKEKTASKSTSAAKPAKSPKTDKKPSSKTDKKPSPKKKEAKAKPERKSNPASISKEKPSIVPVIEAAPEPEEPATPGEARVPTGNITVRLGGAPEHGDPHYRIAVDGRQVATGNVDWSLGLPALEGSDDLRICWQDVELPWDFSDGPPGSVAVRYDEAPGTTGRTVRLLINHVDVDGVRMDAFGPYADFPSGQIPWPGDASRDLVSWTGDAVFNVTGAYAGDPALSVPEKPEPESMPKDAAAPSAEPLVIQVTRDDLRNAAVMSELTALQAFVAGRDDPGIDAQRAADWRALGMVPGAWSEIIILHPDGNPIEPPPPLPPVAPPAAEPAPEGKPEPVPAAKPEPQDLVIHLSQDDLSAPEVIEEFRAMRAFIRGEADDDPRAGRWTEMGLAGEQWSDVRLLNPDGSELDAETWEPPRPEPQPEPEPEPEPEVPPVPDGAKVRDAFFGETLGRALGQLEASIGATEELLSVLSVDEGIRLKQEFLDSVFQRALEPKVRPGAGDGPEPAVQDVPAFGREAGLRLRQDYLDGVLQRAMRQADDQMGGQMDRSSNLDAR